MFVPAVGLAILLLAAACGTSGRTMQAPTAGATDPPRRADATTTSAPASANTLAPTTLFTVTSADFAPGGLIPKTATCDGEGVAPAFNWVNVPPGTVELALTVTDPDADNFVHWVVAGIPVAATAIVPGGLPDGTVQLASGAGTNTYAPLCPPAGETHTYDFTLYALTAPSGLTAASPTKDALISLASTAAGTAVLTGDYTSAKAS